MIIATTTIVLQFATSLHMEFKMVHTTPTRKCTFTKDDEKKEAKEIFVRGSFFYENPNDGKLPTPKTKLAFNSICSHLA